MDLQRKNVGGRHNTSILFDNTNNKTMDKSTNKNKRGDAKSGGDERNAPASIVKLTPQQYRDVLDAEKNARMWRSQGFYRWADQWEAYARARACITTQNTARPPNHEHGDDTASKLGAYSRPNIFQGAGMSHPIVAKYHYRRQFSASDDSDEE